MGNEFAQGDWLLRQRAWAFRPPGYPLYLAAMHTAFGTYGIAAASIFQMLADFALALVTAWSCAKVAGNRAGALVGLALSFCCISRSCFMVHLLAVTPAILALYHRFAARLFRKTVTS
jgi:hypothetical protein